MSLNVQGYYGYRRGRKVFGGADGVIARFGSNLSSSRTFRKAYTKPVAVRVQPVVKKVYKKSNVFFGYLKGR